MATDTRKTYAPGTPCWVDLSTSDPAAAKQFYGALLGWTYNDFSTPMGIYSMALKDGQQVCAIQALRAEQSHCSPNWMVYVATASADDSVARTQSLGGSVVLPAGDVMDVGRMAIVSDPTGAVIALWEARQHTGADITHQPGAMCWAELMTPDTAKASAFYTGLFGWRPETMPMPGMEYTIFNTQQPASGMMEWKQSPAHWLNYFSVISCDDTVQQTEALGGKVVAPPQTVPNVGRFAVLQDPQGAYFAILQPEKK